MDVLVARLRAISEPTRLRIIALLSRGELTVSELVSVLGQSQPRVSRHLRLLTEAGIAERLPEGANVYYRLITEGASGEISTFLRRMLPVGDPVLRRDLARLDEIKEARRRAIQDYFNKVSADWDRIRRLHLSEEEVEAAILEAAGPSRLGLLVDVGVGTGRMLEIFADRIERGIGIDNNRMMLNIARINLENAGIAHCSVREADVTAMPLSDSSVDLMTVHQVLHYLSDPGVAIRECSRALIPGGRLIIVDFAPHQMEQLRDDFAHRRLGFSDEEVTEWVRQSGLDILERVSLSAPQSDGMLTVKLWVATKI